MIFLKNQLELTNLGLGVEKSQDILPATEVASETASAYNLDDNLELFIASEDEMDAYRYMALKRFCTNYLQAIEI